LTLTTDLLIALFIAYGYWILFAAILLDNAGLPIPGEFLLLAFGAVARVGHLDPLLGVAIAAMAALAGDSVGYWIGRAGGTRVIARLGRSPRFTPGRLTVVFGRFVVGARVLLAPLAGVSRMPFRRFLMFDAVGCIVWTGLFILIGYGSGLTLESMQHGMRWLGLIAQSFIAAALATWLITRLVAQGRKRTTSRPV
jgi:membrane protein DedA with SNARE-associated domain